MGGSNRVVKKILLTLDVTPDSVKYAENFGAELIVSHHPVIFDPLKKIHEESPIYSLIQSNIAVISAHTNLDKAEGGVNDALARKLGLENICIVESSDPEDSGLARIGTVSITDIEMFARHVKSSLNSDYVEFSGNSPVCKVCVVGGAGGSFLLDAKNAGADTFVTGEVKYSHFVSALENGMNLIVAGHYFTENIVLEPLKDYILSTLNDVTVEIFNSKFTRKI